MWGEGLKDDANTSKEARKPLALAAVDVYSEERSLCLQSTRFFFVFGLSSVAAVWCRFAEPSRIRLPASLARLIANAYTSSRFTSAAGILSRVCLSRGKWYERSRVRPVVFLSTFDISPASPSPARAALNRLLAIS